MYLRFSKGKFEPKSKVTIGRVRSVLKMNKFHECAIMFKLKK